MPADKIIPTALAVQQILGCVVCLLCHRWNDALYWFGGALLTFSVAIR